MTIALISFALFMGIVLIFLEVFAIPGTTIFGIFGAVLSAVAIYFAYKYLGTNAGHLSIIIGFVAFVILFFVGKKFMDKSNFSLHKELTEKVNKFEANAAVGDTGIAHTDIKPNGKAVINNEKMEVYSNGEYITKGEKIEVIKIIQNKIFIKQTT